MDRKKSEKKGDMQELECTKIGMESEEMKMYTVIVADDEEELRRALIRRVDWESIGFSVVGEAENGAEALELVEKYEPDLLLTDIRMPFISGIELARQVREVQPAMQIVFLSGYDDFTYAQQAIQYNIISYLLKPISAAELTEELKKIREKIDEKYHQFVDDGGELGKLEIQNMVMPWLLDGFQGEAGEDRNRKLMKEAVSAGLLKADTGELKFIVIVTGMVDFDGKIRTTKNMVHAVDSILMKYVKHVSFYSEGRIISLLIASQAGFDKYLHIAVGEIAQSVKRIMNFSCLIGVSRPAPGLSDVHEAYMEAMNAIQYSKRNRTEVSFISDIERGQDVDLERIEGYISELENLLRGGGRQELEEFLNRIFDRIEKENMAVSALYFMMVQLVSAVFRIVYSVVEKDAVTELQGSAPLLTGDAMENFALMHSRYIAFCLKARDLISEQRKKSSTVLCDKALGIIESQYMNQDISLVSVSNEISVSPNYLSALIRKSTGKTFIDLLTQKRIETAKDLLLCTNMKIKDISEKCGYNDQHYFSYCFKKYIGLSPNAYKQNMEDKG